MADGPAPEPYFSTVDPPWLALPREVSDVLRPFLPAVVESIINAVPQLVPAYARPIEGRFGRGLRRGVAGALDRFLDLPGTSMPALSPETRLLVAGLGSGEFRQGRSMDALLGAYRSGARVTFRELSKISMDNDLGSSVVVNLGESILAYIDELSAVSAEAYAFEQSERAGEVERRRKELLGLLLTGQTEESSLRQAAAMADWVLPPRMLVVTVPVENSPGLRLRLGNGTLVVERETDVVALVPARGTLTARAELTAALHGRGAVVGPAVDWGRVADSLRLAVLAASAASAEQVADGLPVWADEHLSEIVLGAEPTAIAELAAQRLEPLRELRATQRERLEETLLSWLRHWGQRTPVAEELGIHAQTVGYRVAQLRELFGEELEDPRTRFELELALRAARTPATRAAAAAAAQRAQPGETAVKRD
ncbi:MAG: helix-turn-helix domain-containing protein [Arthrobacter sp.]|uniref:PucR family transcriptional regulator n=1 Tax=Arthrobacter sp. TaxID=1667 RepID=UPI003477D8D7